VGERLAFLRYEWGVDCDSGLLSRNSRDELLSRCVKHLRVRTPTNMTQATTDQVRAGQVPGSTEGGVFRIEDLVRDHSAIMYRLAASIVHDHALAEDVVQESMMKAWQGLDSFRGDASPRTWLLRITHNTAISLLRKRRDDVTSPNDLPEIVSSGSVEESAVGSADAHEIWNALSKLDPMSRSIVVLREVDELSYEEIAEVLDTPVATVRTRLFRARQQLVRTGVPR
jgi:RNA polymerase sigma-70 factor, ECF subfamily